MHKKISFILATILLIALVPAFVSAYGYGGDYERSYYSKETANANGYSYTTKTTQESPYGKEISYHQVRDYDMHPAGYSYWRDYKYNNALSNYFLYGPDYGYSDTKYYLSYNYDDSYRRTLTGSQYHPYYYEPRYNGQYWDHSYSGCNYHC